MRNLGLLILGAPLGGMANRKPGRPAGLIHRRTNVIRVEKKSATLRTTVPLVVTESLGLQSGDQILWTVEIRTGKVTVRRDKPS